MPVPWRLPEITPLAWSVPPPAAAATRSATVVRLPFIPPVSG